VVSRVASGDGRHDGRRTSVDRRLLDLARLLQLAVARLRRIGSGGARRCLPASGRRACGGGRRSSPVDVEAPASAT
jgi:hypothetical protein